MAVTCPQCGAGVPHARVRLRLTCASCGLGFDNPALYLPPAAEQVRRDRRGVNGAILVLGVLGVLGAFSLGAASPAFLLIALLGVFGFSTWCSDKPAATHPVVKILVGLFAVAGVVVLLGIAAVVFLFIMCASGEFKWNG